MDEKVKKRIEIPCKGSYSTIVLAINLLPIDSKGAFVPLRWNADISHAWSSSFNAALNLARMYDCGGGFGRWGSTDLRPYQRPALFY